MDSVTTQSNVIAPANVPSSVTTVPPGNVVAAPPADHMVTPSDPGLVDPRSDNRTQQSAPAHQSQGNTKAKQSRRADPAVASAPSDFLLVDRYLEVRPDLSRIPAIVKLVAPHFYDVLPRQVTENDFRSMLLSALLSNLYYRVKEANSKVQNLTHPMDVISYFPIPLFLARIVAALLPVDLGDDSPKVICETLYLAHQIDAISAGCNIKNPLSDSSLLIRWQALHIELARKLTKDVFVLECRPGSLLVSGVLQLDEDEVLRLEAAALRNGVPFSMDSVPRTVVSRTRLSRNAQLLCAVLRPREYVECGQGSWYAPLLSEGEMRAFGVTVGHLVAGRGITWHDVQKETLIPMFKC